MLFILFLFVIIVMMFGSVASWLMLPFKLGAALRRWLIRKGYVSR